MPLLTTPPSGAPVGANASVSGVNTTGTYRVDFILVCANAIAETDPNAAVGAPSTMGNAAAVIGKVFVTGDNCVLYAVNYDSATGTPVYTPGSGNTLSVTGAVCLAKSVACIQVNPLPTFTLTPTNPVCPSTTNGSIFGKWLNCQCHRLHRSLCGSTSGTLSNQTASASGTIDITGLTGSASSNKYTVTVTNSSGCSASNTTTVASVTCCPTLSSAPANVTIVNSTCQQVCTVAGGSISAPSGTPCPTGSHIEYSTDGGNTWTSTLPTYGAGVSVQTRCECDLDAKVVSPASTAVSTSPGTCTDPTPTAVSSNDLTCIVTTSTLSITGLSAGTYNYNWAASAGGTISGGTTSATATGISAGTYEVTVTNATTGCSATSSMNVTANTTAPTPTASSSNNLTCTVTSTSLSVTGLSAGTYSYNWATSGGGNISGSTTSATATGTSAGTYLVTVTNTANGCTATSSVGVTSTTTPPLADAGPDLELTCTTTSLVIGTAAVSGNTYAWSPATGLSATNIAQPTASALTPYTVTVTNTASGCTSSDAVVVTLNNTAPTASAGSDQTLTCTATSVLLGAASVSGYSYAWSPSAGLSATNIAQPTASASGTYTVTVTNTANGCTASDAVVVGSNTTAPTPTASSSNNLTCTVTSTSLSVTGLSAVHYSYNWATSGGGNISGSTTSATATGTSAGTYLVTVTNTANGCTATSSVSVTSTTTPPLADAVQTSN
ncbi:MAG: hypothetical protein IPL33_14295 [Sphingobacteriales bacterium]|nr:hypothetical protein [Sphingobacteriales bacterium]